MSMQFALCLATLLFLAGIGTPIGHSTIIAGVVYLAVGGQDLALAGEQALWGIYDSFVLLAVPLFIAAANIMPRRLFRLVGFSWRRCWFPQYRFL